MTPRPKLPPCNEPARPRLRDLTGKTVGLLDIGKMRGSEYIDRLEALLQTRGIRTKRYAKPTNTRTAPIPILQAVATECDAVIIALSDCGSCTSCSTHDLNDLDLRGIPRSERAHHRIP